MALLRGKKVTKNASKMALLRGKKQSTLEAATTLGGVDVTSTDVDSEVYIEWLV